MRASAATGHRFRAHHELLARRAGGAGGRRRARAYEHSVDYAKERKTFGQPIATRQAVAFSIADMRIELDAARMLVWEAAWQLDRGEKATKETYLAKLYADEMVLKVTDDAVMVMGGHGFIRENPVERWLRNGRGFAAFEGMAMV